MTRQDIRELINCSPLTDFEPLEPSPKAGRDMYCCPVCGSGHGRNRTGALHLDPNTNRVKCFSGNCFTDKGEDTLGALRIIWQCSESEVFERLGYTAEPEYTHTLTSSVMTEPKTMASTEPTASIEPVDNTSFYRQAHEDLLNSPEALEYLHGRGIVDEMIERFNLGYCENWKHSKAGETVPATKRIIIPRTTRTYTARRIDEPQNEIETRYTKVVEGKQKDLFNLQALEKAEILFVCEGELDAISLYQAGAKSVIGIGTINNAEVLIEEAKKHPDIIYILVLDNDPDKENGTNPGKDAQKRIATDMDAAGLNAFCVNPSDFYDEAKDANEALVKKPDRLKKMVAYVSEKAYEMKARRDEEREAELYKCTGEGMVDDFLERIMDKEKRLYEPISTGISDIDRALNGGFTRGTLVTLGAPPAMGKTAFAQWIFENMASNGKDVVFKNLEMSRDQLLSRSLSRYIWKYENKDFSSQDILRGYKWTQEETEIILRATKQYKANIAKRFKYNPDNATNTIDSILKSIREETARIKALGRETPLICIDYLHLIDSGDRDAVEGMKNVIKILKDFAVEENTVVFLVIANNRASNKNGTMDMESGRDTSAIEYSGDLMLGLSYTAIEEHRKYECGRDKHGEPLYAEYTLDKIRELEAQAYDRGEEPPLVCKEVTFKVVKNRFGSPNRRVKLYFDGKHSIFRLVANDRLSAFIAEAGENFESEPEYLQEELNLT